MKVLLLKPPPHFLSLFSLLIWLLHFSKLGQGKEMLLTSPPQTPRAGILLFTAESDLHCTDLLIRLGQKLIMPFLKFPLSLSSGLTVLLLMNWFNCYEGPVNKFPPILDSSFSMMRIFVRHLIDVWRRLNSYASLYLLVVTSPGPSEQLKKAQGWRTSWLLERLTHGDGDGDFA